MPATGSSNCEVARLPRSRRRERASGMTATSIYTAFGLSSRRRARGSVLINTAIALSLIVITLVGTELGYLFYMKREFQKTVDLAALAGAQKLTPSAPSSGCDLAVGAASVNATQNLLGTAVNPPECGSWVPNGPSNGNAGCFQGITDHFTPGGTPSNAVRVRIQKAPPALLPFFSSDRTICVQAVAALGAPVATFSVGTKLVTVENDSLLGRSLKSIGLNLSGSLVGYDGLAQIKITPSGLLKELGVTVTADMTVGQIDALIDAKTVSLAQVLNATVKLAGMSELLTSNLDLLEAITAVIGIDSLDFSLSSLLKITAPDSAVGSALNVGLNAFDVLFAGIGIATQKHALSVPDLGVLNLVKAKVALVEPPSIAVGGVGATAYTGQLRTFVRISTADIPVIGSIARVNLPIMIDAVTGTGTLMEMCTPGLRDSSGVDHARIAVQASILKVCVGRPGADPSKEDEIFSTSASCDTNLENEQLLKVGLLGVDLVSLTTKLKVNPLPLNASVILAAGETETVGNDLLIGTTIKNLTDALLASLLANSLNTSVKPTAQQREKMAAELWGATACTNSSCRKARLTQINNQIANSANGLSGFLGDVVHDSLNIVNQLVSLDVLGLLNGVGNLVGNLLTSVGDLLGNILGGLFGNQCTGGGLYGEGSDQGCRNEISDSLKGSSSGSSAPPNAIISLVSFLMNALRPVLDDVGSKILTPILQKALGLHLGQVDVNMRALNCHAEPTLVY
ncbi:hypothetical protein CKY39_28060 [Variovorax boronicumulans]|uniref:DUF2134 domain-containing protein n=1 Tax=Variovorax boronicumulans TaxID=436515 RepID=A0A250DQK6_9BURK|nr:hypothetical protein CKY39_28060 [Variovorax boronicumulans]